MADEGFRPRAISLVLAGGVVAALLGPLLARLGGDLLQPTFAASFLLLSAASAIAVGVLLSVDVPRSADTPQERAAARPLGEIIRQPSYVKVAGHDPPPSRPYGDIDSHPAARSGHVPAIVLYRLTDRPLWRSAYHATGIVLLTAHVLFALSGTGFYNFTAALILLGVGWNFLYIGGTNLLTRTYTTAEKGKAQATNDLAIFIVGLAESLSADVLQSTIGWQALNMWLLPWLAVAAAAVLWLQMSPKGGGYTRLNGRWRAKSWRSSPRLAATGASAAMYPLTTLTHRHGSASHVTTIGIRFGDPVPKTAETTPDGDTVPHLVAVPRVLHVKLES